MLPNNSASSLAIPDLLYDPDDRTTSPLRDFELGGLALNNASGGLMQIVWTLDYVGLSVGVTPAGGTRIPLFNLSGITDLALTFDQNMRVAVAYVRGGQLYLRWFDSVSAQFITSNYGYNHVSPRLTLDDKRESQNSHSDMVLAYVKNQQLCYRQQRDRFMVERVLRSDLPKNMRLRTIGMGKGMRLQFEMVMA